MLKIMQKKYSLIEFRQGCIKSHYNESKILKAFSHRNLQN